MASAAKLRTCSYCNKYLVEKEGYVRYRCQIDCKVHIDCHNKHNLGRITCPTHSIEEPVEFPTQLDDTVFGNYVRVSAMDKVDAVEERFVAMLQQYEKTDSQPHSVTESLETALMETLRANVEKHLPPETMRANGFDVAEHARLNLTYEQYRDYGYTPEELLDIGFDTQDFVRMQCLDSEYAKIDKAFLTNPPISIQNTQYGSLLKRRGKR